jgi:hypothetical protein
MSNENNNRRALLSTIARQQQIIDNQARRLSTVSAQVDFIARVAGISEQVKEISKHADIMNPAQPVPDPASSGPTRTTQETATPEARDNAQLLGETPGSVNNLAADQVDTALRPGQSIPTSPWGTPTDVTSPVAGTETHVPNELTRLEVDVRVGDPNNPQIAFPLLGGPEVAATEQGVGGQAAAASRNRVVASLNLARLRIAAGLAKGDDLSVSAAIESDSSLSNEMIAHEINILSGVNKAASKQARTNNNLVPRKASASRTTPSFVGDNAPGIVSTGAVTAEETADSDLFF